MTTKKPTPADIETALQQFTGTEKLYRHPLSKLVYTDGVKYLADAAGAYWLIDAVGSYQTRPELRGERLQMWRLERDGDRARLTCSRDIENGRPVDVYVTQDITFTDFPLAGVTLYVADGVLLLPSEY